MEFQSERNRIYVRDGDRLIAEITFPERDGVADIDHTFVDDCLRGQGVAGQLVERAAAQIRASGWKAQTTCSYAAKWFEKHTEQQNLLNK